MTLILFSKCSKVNVDYKIGIKNSKDVYNFSDNGIRIGRTKLTLFLVEYSKSAVKVTTSSPKVSKFCKKNFSKLNLTQSEKKCVKIAFLQISDIFGTR